MKRIKNKRVREVAKKREKSAEPIFWAPTPEIPPKLLKLRHRTRTICNLNYLFNKRLIY